MEVGLIHLVMSTSNVAHSANPTAAVRAVPTGPVELGQAITKLLQDREKPLRILKTFSNVTTVSRQMLAGVQNKVNLHTQIKDADIQLEYLFTEWLDCCGKSEAELEEQSDPLRPSLIAAKFNESGEVLDKTDEAFKSIKEKYPAKQEVIDYLDFVDKPVKAGSSEGSLSSQKSPSVTVALGKGEEYVKAKLPKLKTEIKTRFLSVKKKFAEAKVISEHQLNQVPKQLENLEAKLDDDSPFENLLKDAYSFPDYDKAEIAEHEE